MPAGTRCEARVAIWSDRVLTVGPKESSARVEGAARHRDWLLLVAATLAFSFGFGTYSGLIPNFAAEHLGLSRAQLGLLESLREIPGLLTAGMIALLAGLAEPVLAILALGVMAGGIAATGQATGFGTLVACSIFWSIGLHIWLTLQPSVALTLSEEGKHGRGLGLLARYGAFAMLAGLLFVASVGPALDYPRAFGIAGAAILVGCVAARAIRKDRGGGLHPRLVFRRRYRLYYLLMLLDGGRRVLIQTFALLILVREFGVHRQGIAGLMLVTNGITMLLAPVVGGWVDRYGERRVLSLYYLAVVGVFIAYTRVHTALAFSAIYAVDNLLFTCAVGIPTYARHLCPKEDLSPTLAMGLTVNHVAAVSVPISAGFLWAHLGYRTIFWAGAALAVVSLLGALQLPARRK
jgi:predicted MFS family arabinose efflux permease